MINFLYLTCAILTITSLALASLFRGASKRFNLKLQKNSVGFKIEIDDLNQEVIRQSVILDDYKDRLKFITLTNAPKISTYNNAPSQDTVQNMLTDKQQLEKEKEQFKQKNQKLWEQSLAVYKEKERIDSIRKYVESQHTNLTHSINYALRIQEALLPSEELLKQILPHHFIFYRPRDIVSGDFYWTKQIKNKTIIIVADCTGHGVPGAFMSLLGISYLNEISSSIKEISAAQILEELREKIKLAFKQDNGSKTINDGMDMVVCILDHENMNLEFSGANNGIFIASNKKLTEIKGTRNPVSSYRKEKPFENHIIKLQQNDSIFMYSDGYFDQFGGSHKQKITRARFNKILTECISKGASMPEIKNELVNFLDKWQGEEIQIDDILIFGVTCFTDEREVAFFE